MRKKFKIMYPQDHPDKKLAGKPYSPPNKCMVVMNRSGVFFLVDMSDYYTYITKLSYKLPEYDVVWK